MLELIKENLSTFIVCLIIAIALIGAFYKIIKDKKSGKSYSCISCEGCDKKWQCHNKHF